MLPPVPRIFLRSTLHVELRSHQVRSVRHGASARRRIEGVVGAWAPHTAAEQRGVPPPAPELVRGLEATFHFLTDVSGVLAGVGRCSMNFSWKLL